MARALKTTSFWERAGVELEGIKIILTMLARFGLSWLSEKLLRSTVF